MPPIPPSSSPHRQTGNTPGGLAARLASQSPKAVPLVKGKARWVDGKVTLVQVITQRRMNKVFNAKLFGNLAVHPTTLEGGLDPNSFSLSSATTGLLIATVDREQDAMRIGELLHAESNDAFSHDDHVDVLAALPKWLYHWIRACRVARAWVNPESFRK